MGKRPRSRWPAGWLLCLTLATPAFAQETREHDHLPPFEGGTRRNSGHRHSRPPLAVRPAAGPGRNRARQGDEPGRPLAQQLLHRRSPLDAVEARHGLRRLGGQRPSTTSTTPEPPASTATSSPPSPISTASTSTASPTRRPARSTIRSSPTTRIRPGSITSSPNAPTSS